MVTHAHVTLLMSKHCCLLLLAMHKRLLGSPLLLHECGIHCDSCQPIFNVECSRWGMFTHLMLLLLLLLLLRKHVGLLGLQV